MNKLLGIPIILAGMAASGGAQAAERTVILAVQNMTCAACPYIVQKSMSTVDGVKKVDVSFDDKTATVIFDDAKTTVDAIAAASGNAGYPAALKE
jgi:periplasmic mercuric ion binding protein